MESGKTVRNEKIFKDKKTNEDKETPESKKIFGDKNVFGVRNLFKEKAYTFLDVFFLQFKIIPFHTLFQIANLIFGGIYPACQTVFLGMFIDTAGKVLHHKEAGSAIYLPLLLILCGTILIHLIPSLTDVIMLHGSNRFQLAVDYAVLEKKARLDLGYTENKDSADLIERASKKCSGNFKQCIGNLYDGAQLVITVVSLLAVIVKSSALSAVVIVAVSLPLIFIAQKLGERSYNNETKAMNIEKRYKNLSGILTGRESARERTLFAYGDQLRTRYNALADSEFGIERHIKIQNYLIIESGSIVTLLVAVVIIGLLLPAFIHGKISGGIYVALIPAILNLVQSMSWQLSDLMQTNAWGREYLKEFSQFVRMGEKKDALCEPAYDCNFLFHSLEFADVTFCYPGTDTKVLDHCSFLMTGAKSYAIVGENGAGKSTVIKLVMGMYENYEGTILLNGKNIRLYSYGEIKHIFSAVWQNFTKYELSFSENVRLGNLAKQADIRPSLAGVGLSAAVQGAPAGPDTYLGRIKKGSIDLSGGQWQRLAIARLLYTEAPVNILDEPTAALDPLEETRVYRMFRQMKGDRFTIYITHRLGAARIADEILVLSGGKVVEQGAHDTLMRQTDGLYHQMFDSQRQWYQ